MAGTLLCTPNQTAAFLLKAEARRMTLGLSRKKFYALLKVSRRFLAAKVGERLPVSLVHKTCRKLGLKEDDLLSVGMRNKRAEDAMPGILAEYKAKKEAHDEVISTLIQMAVHLFHIFRAHGLNPRLEVEPDRTVTAVLVVIILRPLHPRRACRIELMENTPELAFQIVTGDGPGPQGCWPMSPKIFELVEVLVGKEGTGKKAPLSVDNAASPYKKEDDFYDRD